MTDIPLAVTSPTRAPSGLSRRALLGSAAWSVPAIVAVSAVPAVAASSATALALTTPNMQVVASGITTLTVQLSGASGQSQAGRAVSFSGPSTAQFTPVTATTDSTGKATTRMTTTDTWATPGSTLTVSATTSDATATGAFTILGANAYAAGSNRNSQLGTGSASTTISTPIQLLPAFPSPVRALAAGLSFTLALLDDGSVWSVGLNDSGQLGDGTTTARTRWGKIPSLSTVTRIAAGSNTGYALRSDGTVWAWGENTSGEVGTGTTASPVSSPAQVTGVSAATQITAGSHSAYALLTDGRVRAWGQNTNGQAGNGTVTTANSAPVSVSGIVGATQVVAGATSTYALVGGQVMAWGQNTTGQLGNGSTTDSPVPVVVSGITEATRLAATTSTGYALVGGQVRAWGMGTSGQLGNGTTTTATAPVTVSAITDATQITAGGSSAYALTSAGVVAWGGNASGQLGNGNTGSSSTPVAVRALANVTVLGENMTGASAMFFVRR